jgi:hypothetical protein
VSVAQHTPGPWKAFNKDGKHVQADEWSTDCEGALTSTHAPIKAGSRVVALVVASSKRWPDLPDIAPDCRLIAAAPELLEACRSIVNAFDALKPSSAARTEPMQINAARAAIAKAEGRAP